MRVLLVLAVLSAALAGCEGTAPIGVRAVESTATTSPEPRATSAATPVMTAPTTPTPTQTPMPVVVVGTMPSIARQVIAAGTTVDHVRLASLMQIRSTPYDARPVSSPTAVCKPNEPAETLVPSVEYILTLEGGNVSPAFAAQTLQSEFAGGLAFIAAGPTPVGSSSPGSKYMVAFKRAADGRNVAGVTFSNPAALAGLPTCAYLDDSAIITMRLNCSADVERLSSRYPWP